MAGLSDAYQSDVDRRRSSGAYGAQTYDVQNSGPGILETLGLIGMMHPLGWLGRGVQSAMPMASEAAGLAPYGASAAASALRPAELIKSGANQLGPATNTAFGSIGGIQIPSMTHGPAIGMMERNIGSANEFSQPLGIGGAEYLNALMRQRSTQPTPMDRGWLSVIPGGKK